MNEKYRDRSGRIVTLTYDQLSVLDLTKTVVVDVGDEEIEFYIDGYNPINSDVDNQLVLMPSIVERLYSGYVSRFYGVLDTDGDGDLVLMAEDRPNHEFEFAGDEYREIEIDEVHVDGDGTPIDE